MHRLVALAGMLLLCVVTAACPGGNATKSEPAPCTKLGDQCLLEPGKLGACAYRANCDGPSCLYCQSQH